jgi:probable F420-dependent oxidoreductase
VQLGVAYPTTEAAGDPDAVRRFIRAAEDLGFDYLMHYDHVVKATHEGRDRPLDGPYTEKDSFHDPFVFFGFAAGITERLEFATGVLILPQRQTALAAQQAANVDLLCKGRLRLGVGVGWNWIEFEALGQDFATRGKRLDEQIGLMRRYWAEPLVSFEGRFDRVDRAGINPRPRRQIPIWIGGHTEPAYERAGRLGDGFIFAGKYMPPVEAMARVRHHLREAGRDEAGFGREYLAYAKGLEDGVDAIRAWRDAGGTHACATTTGLGLGADIDAHIDVMAEYRRRVG